MTTMKRSITHWTGGPGRATALDRKHYHKITEFDGVVVDGKEAVEDNIVTSDGDYAAHTLNLNTASGGFAMAGMNGAVEEPFDPGRFPINEVQFEAHCRDVLAPFHLEYGIPVTDKTCLTHAEVEGTLGVKQRGKWDLTRLPFKPELRGARAVGDYMRERVLHHMGAQPAPLDNRRPVLRFGDRGAFVLDLQDQLDRIHYFVGKIDGKFGRRTREAVLGFQADHGIEADGIVGPQTWATLRTAGPREDREVSDEELAKSRTIKAATGITRTSMATVGITGGVTLSEAISYAQQLEDAEGWLETGSRIVMAYWPALVVILIGLVIWRYGRQIKAFRTEDARTGRNLGR
jgi:hypothetical protein